PAPAAVADDAVIDPQRAVIADGEIGAVLQGEARDADPYRLRPDGKGDTADGQLIRARAVDDHVVLELLPAEPDRAGKPGGGGDQRRGGSIPGVGQVDRLAEGQQPVVGVHLVGRGGHLENGRVQVEYGAAGGPLAIPGNDRDGDVGGAALWDRVGPAPGAAAAV